MKQFVKPLPIEGDCFKYLISAFPSLSFEKIKANVFDGPQIRQLVKDEYFIVTVTELQKNAWLAFRNIVKYFLGNTRAQIYTEILQQLLENYKMLGCNLSIKSHFLHSHLADFPKNLGAVSDEQRERFHQDLKVMEARYQGRWDVHMMTDYCWSIKREFHRLNTPGKAISENFHLLICMFTVW
ncbi:hypothetical protein AVEN_21475-1 [Araneus ventricosus]|uniref:Uncharacterized protein n=1 Tax=Araneus ventricosus TaxID=182803 RepID=A0A4Y2EQS0_ARAVE|nr:hypothetical protein AVEN_21475-1 [Araneus ventricosus]